MSKRKLQSKCPTLFHALLYGRPDFEVNFKARKVEPRAEVRGDIARIYFYMADRYGLRLSKQDRQLFNAWSKSDPVSVWEREKARQIMILQGNINRFVE
ncbi:endonuclease [Kiloniella sp.]|uniref:endonuclease n=1 Tax=Kiloniella sp. TaxID=1938587 RepID=UPI003B01F22A